MYKQAVGFWDVPRHIALRVRYQLVGGFLFAVGIPLIRRMLFVPDVPSNANHQITIAATIVALFGGYMLYHRLGTYPGFTAAGAILPTFALTYGTVFVIIFFFRFDYSRFQAAGSFIMSTVWYFGWSFLVSKLQPTRLAVVPADDIGQVKSIGDVTWRVLTSPSQPPERIQGVVADLRADISGPSGRFIADCALSGIPVYHVKQIVEPLTGRVSIDHLVTPLSMTGDTFGAIPRLPSNGPSMALPPLFWRRTRASRHLPNSALSSVMKVRRHERLISG